MILRGITNIRDVIAFPKTQSGADLMCGSPSPIDEKQLREANIRIAMPVKPQTTKAP
jgi:aspartyl-tRNA synthetase